MDIQNAEESAVALKKFYDSITAILQMENDGFDVYCNTSFLDKLTENSRLLSLCNGTLQQVIDRVKARLDNWPSGSKNQSPIDNYEPKNSSENIENETSDVENSSHEMVCYESSSHDSSERNGSGREESNKIQLQNKRIDHIESMEIIAEEVHFTVSKETHSMQTVIHYDSEQKYIDSNEVHQQYQSGHHAMNSNGEFVANELLNVKYINSYEIAGNYRRNFVIEPSQQLEMNEEPVECDVQTPDISTTFQMDPVDIQAEVDVETTPMNINGVNIQAKTENKSRPKRTIKPTARAEFSAKRARCMSMDSRSAQNAESKNAKMVKAKEKRQSAIRKTVSDEQKTVKNCEELKEDNGFGRNTDQQMFPKNNLYRTLCVRCNENRAQLVMHYVNVHGNYEVPIARPSPSMADKLRLQSLAFKKVNKKILGVCIFCEEDKGMMKLNWETHLLTHTGEKMYSCKTCHASMKRRSKHGSGCSGDIVRIYNENTTDASVIGFMCNECNYLQISRERIVKHLEIEHGFLGPSEINHYRKLKLINIR